MEKEYLEKLKAVKINENRFSTLMSIKSKLDENLERVKDWPVERKSDTQLRAVVAPLAILFGVLEIIFWNSPIKDITFILGLPTFLCTVFTLASTLDLKDHRKKYETAVKEIEEKSQSFYQGTKPLYKAVLEHNNAVQVIQQTVHMFEASNYRDEDDGQFYNLIGGLIHDLENNYPILTQAVDRYEALANMPTDIGEQFEKVAKKRLAMKEDLNLSFASDMRQLKIDIDFEEVSVPELSEVLKYRRLMAARDELIDPLQLSSVN